MKRGVFASLAWCAGLAAAVGLGYAMFDLLLVLVFQPSGMDTVLFLAAYAGVTAVAVTVAAAAIGLPIALLLSASGHGRVLVCSGFLGAGLFIAFARLQHWGLEQLVLPLRGLAHADVARGVLLLLVMAVLIFGVFEVLRVVGRRPRLARALGGLTLGLPASLAGVCVLVAVVQAQPLPLIVLTLLVIASASVLAGPRLLLGLYLLAVASLGAAAPLAARVAQRPPVAAPPPGQALPAGAPRHILLAVSDTLRRDALGCYSASAPPTPAIDAFAAEAIRFDRAYAPCSWTTPSMVSIHTGLLPAEHGVLDQAPLPAKETTLAERLSEAGYATAVIGSNAMLRPKAFGLDRGFQFFDWYPRDDRRKSYLGSRLLAHLFPKAWPYDRDTQRLTDRAIEWYANNRDVPSFLWLHYFDPHEDFEPPAPFEPATAMPARLAASGVTSLIPRIRGGYLAQDRESREFIRKLYHGEVRYVDREFGRLIEFLKQAGLYDDMAIVFVSDHGEEFWEHDQFGHAHTLFSEVLDVPLIVKPAGGFEPGVVRAPISTADLCPTILEMASAAPETMAGRSMLHADGREERPLFASGTLYFEPQSAVIAGTWKLIRWHTSRRYALFDLAVDTGEARNVLDAEPDTAARLKALLDVYNAGAPAQPGSEEKRTLPVLDKVTEERLRSLGYVQ